MILCDSDIELLLKNRDLIIDPLPLKKDISGVSVDIKLGNKFRRFKKCEIPYIDLDWSKEHMKANLKRIMDEEIQLSSKDSLLLNPKELILGLTHEYLSLPNNLIGWLNGKSSLARLGLLINTTAHRIDPGWKGYIVLECYNLGALPLLLKPGLAVGALSFELLSGSCTKPYSLRSKARYFNQLNIKI